MAVNGIGDAGVRAVAEALKTSRFLETLHLACEHGGGYAGGAGEAVGGRTACKRTGCRGKGEGSDAGPGLAGNMIGDEGARAVAEALKTNRSLETLDLECEHGGGHSGGLGKSRGG